jgi:hypothetical protein
VEPVPLSDKREKLGLGRMTMEVCTKEGGAHHQLETAEKTTETRRLLEAEMEQTPELLRKWKVWPAAAAHELPCAGRERAPSGRACRVKGDYLRFSVRAMQQTVH